MPTEALWPISVHPQLNHHSRLLMSPGVSLLPLFLFPDIYYYLVELPA